MPEASGSGKQHASAAVMLSHRASDIFPQSGMIRRPMLARLNSDPLRQESLMGPPDYLNRKP
jgi:hypothetical protein